MKITIEHEEQVVSIEDSGVVDIYEAFYLVKRALLGVGYHIDSINGCLDEEAR